MNQRCLLPIRVILQAGESMPPYMGLCFALVVPVLSVWSVHCMEMEEGNRIWRTGHGAGRKNLNSVSYFDTKLLWGHTKVITIFCLLLQPLPALFKHRLALYTSLSSGCTDIKSIAGNFTTKAAVEEPQATPNSSPSKKNPKKQPNQKTPQTSKLTLQKIW